MSESGATSVNSLSSTGASIARTSLAGWPATVADNAAWMLHALDVPGYARQHRARAWAGAAVAPLGQAFAKSSASRLSAAAGSIPAGAVSAARQMAITLS